MGSSLEWDLTNLSFSFEF